MISAFKEFQESWERPKTHKKADLCQSPAECEFLRIVRELGLPEPKQQYYASNAITSKPDFVWPELRIVIYIDGEMFHKDVWQDDLSVTNKWQLQGWRCFRYPASLVFKEGPMTFQLRETFGKWKRRNRRAPAK